jgi:cardiolipin synthase
VSDRILTVPNVLTVLRLCLLPWYLQLLLVDDDRVAAAVLLSVLGATDWCDGYVARHFDQVSRLGKVLDPTADRILFFVGIGGIIAVDGAPLWFCIAVLVREVAVAAVTVTITLLGARPVDVTWFGKAGTFGLMFAFPLFLAGTSDVSSAEVFWALGWVAGLPGLVLSYYAAVLYIPVWRASLAEARAQRATGAAQELLP